MPGRFWIQGIHRRATSHDSVQLPCESFHYSPWDNPVSLSYNPRQMIVTFYQGTLRGETGAELAVSWAETDFGVTALVSGSDELIHGLTVDHITLVEPVTTLDLPGIDREGIDVIVGDILKGGYLDMPGVRGKGEAVLFILVNEAIHRLSEIAEHESDD